MRRKWKGLLSLWLALLVLLSGQTALAAAGDIYVYTGADENIGWSLGDQIDAGDLTMVSVELDLPLNFQNIVSIPDAKELIGWQLWGMSVGSGFLTESLGNLNIDGVIPEGTYNSCVNNVGNEKGTNGLALVPLLTDKSAEPPQVIISIGAHAWSRFYSNSTYDLVFESAQNARIDGTAQDEVINSVWYYLARGGEGYTLDQMDSLSWIPYEGEISLTESDSYVLYAKAEDDSGNAAYASTGGFIIDMDAPVISGVTDGGVYEGDTTFTVSGGNLDSVTVDGQTVTLTNGQYTITADNQVHKIVVRSKMGNEKVCEITVKEKSDTGNTDNTGSIVEGTATLAAGTAYTLGNGKWTVSGDNTVYEGGRSFYVSTGGEYSFSKQ